MNDVTLQGMEQRLDIEENFGLGWATFSANLVPLMLGSMIANAVTVLSLGLLLGPVWVGLTRMCLDAARGRSVSAGQVFSGFRSFPTTFIFGILTLIFVGLGMVMGVLPGLVVLYLIFWAPEFMADGESNPMAAIKRSFELTKTNIIPQLIFVLINYLLGSLGLVVFLGFFLTWPLAGCISVHGYLRAHAPEAPQAPSGS